MNKLYLASFFWGLTSFSVALAQSAQETAQYIRDKLKGEEYEGISWKIHIDDVQLNQSKFLLLYTETSDLFPGAVDTHYKSSEIDIKAMPDFKADAVGKVNDDSTFEMWCDDSYGDCVKTQDCWKLDQNNKCSQIDVHHQARMFLGLEGISMEDRKRVKKAIIHLKSLFPLQKNIEMFDK